MKICLIILGFLLVNLCLNEPNKAIKRLLNQGVSFEKCQKKTGKVGRVAEMLYSNNE